ncbi:MAG: sigma-54-dependent transcriptional regulator [Desulfohalobiaceae bacterium]
MAAVQRICLVDDEKNTLKVLSAFLHKQGYQVETAQSGEQAWDKLKSRDCQLLITDLKLPGKSGLELLEAVKSCWPQMPVIMITAYGSIPNAVQAMQSGAFNYLTKPVNLDELAVLVRNALQQAGLMQENTELRKQLQERFQLGFIVGRSKPMQRIFNMVEKVSGYDSNIIITGETGTGKELIARAIHYSGQQGDRPFVTIDCAVIPESLLESELFGHAKGAFTGATEVKQGQIELAEGGTLFLDEIGELPLSLQKKFLRFLQEKIIVRVGCNKRRKVNVRIIAATNKDLEEEVRAGNWREDLFYRLNVISLEVPPLRERKDDIPLLVDFFLDKYNRQNNKAIKAASSQVLQIFYNYDWPGNVRELENVIERAVVLSGSDKIFPSNLPDKLANLKTGPAQGQAEMNLLSLEYEVINKALEQSGGNQSAAARLLGISRKQLRTKLQNHGLLQ